jgi:signal transduction histidine kinase
MAKRPSKSAAAYVCLLAAAFAVSLAASAQFGTPLNNWAYDEMFRRARPEPAKLETAILAIDDRTIAAIPFGMRGIRAPLARALRIVAAVQPKVVALDLILSNPTTPAEDAALAAAFRSIPNLVLAALLRDDGWETPLPEFTSAAVGHVHAQPEADGVTRAITLQKPSKDRKRYWALALEAYRLAQKADIVEDPLSLQIGDRIIPAGGVARSMRIRFLAPGAKAPRVSMQQILENAGAAEVLRGKVVFVGATSQTEHDTVITPFSDELPTPGVEFNAEVYETIAQGVFLTDLETVWVLLLALGWVAVQGAAFRYLQGWHAYAAATAVLLASMVAPYGFFLAGHPLRFTASVFPAWLGFLTAAGFYHLVVRRNLRRSEFEKGRYQQAMHFVTHEMRTPLSAIQGSSELISRFALTDEKRKQLSLLINSESKRLARMVEIFLNVERLSAGQMELKHEAISVKELVEICAERTHPLAERKHIGLTVQPIPDNLQLTGDRELMEYACYNLLTNAVKYSPQRTDVTVNCAGESGHVKIAVRDQGIGMDQKEVKQIFRKFYRTRKAEESGEAGTGIGLSIVQQIVEQHGGRIDVVSEPGVGSCFTLVLPAAAHAATAPAERQ